MIMRSMASGSAHRRTGSDTIVSDPIAPRPIALDRHHDGRQGDARSRDRAESGLGSRPHGSIRWWLIGLALFGVTTAWLVGCAGVGMRPEPPSVSIASVRPLSIGLDRQRLEFRLRVSNPNAFALPLEGLDFTASLAGEDIATGTSREPVEVPARGDAIVAVTVEAGFGRVLDRLRRMLDERELVLDYAVAGTVTLANWPRPLPFDVTGEVQP